MLSRPHRSAEQWTPRYCAHLAFRSEREGYGGGRKEIGAPAQSFSFFLVQLPNSCRILVRLTRDAFGSPEVRGGRVEEVEERETIFRLPKMDLLIFVLRIWLGS